jgi:hypothetical protein
MNEMHGSRCKIPNKNLVRQRCADGFNSGVKGLTMDPHIRTHVNIEYPDDREPKLKIHIRTDFM